MLNYDSDNKFLKLTTIFDWRVLTGFRLKPNIVRKVQNLSLNFYQVAWGTFTLLTIAMQIVRSILSLNSIQFHQKSYSNGLYIVTYHFL